VNGGCGGMGGEMIQHFIHSTIKENKQTKSLYYTALKIIIIIIQ
jgi:hypothetical protein